jgi:hypothetical protein
VVIGAGICNSFLVIMEQVYSLTMIFYAHNILVAIEE